MYEGMYERHKQLSVVIFFHCSSTGEASFAPVYRFCQEFCVIRGLELIYHIHE